MSDAFTHEETPVGLTESRSALRTVMTGSLASGIAGGGAVAVSILGLAGVVPELFAAIAVIGIGAAFLFESGSVATRFSTLLREAAPGREAHAAELGGGMTAQLLVGIAGVGLGILALVGVVPAILVPISIISFGGALVFGSGTLARLNALEISRGETNETARRVMHEAVSASAGVQVLVGLGAITLGILALIGIAPLILSLAALLGVGGSDLMSGSAVGGKMVNLLRQY